MKSTQITSPTAGLQGKVQITRTGLQLTDSLTFSEWEAMAERFGAAMSSAAFVIGDWLVYGEDHFRGEGRQQGPENKAVPRRRVSGEIYEAALRLTGLDRTTLATYAYVARRVPPSLRNEQLSWEHHKAVARLEPHQQTKWLEIAMKEGGEGEAGPISTRRLRKSITAGRLLTRQEMQIDPADRGQPNHIPHLNRLWVWWLDLRESGWRKEATREQKDALKRDLGIVLQIIQEIG